MNKPFVVKRQEFINNLTNLINESDLPPFVIEPILKEYHSIVVEAHMEQLRIEAEQWAKAQKEKAESEEKEHE